MAPRLRAQAPPEVRIKKPARYELFALDERQSNDLRRFKNRFLASEMKRQPYGNFAPMTGPITGGRDRAAVQLDQCSRERQSHAGRVPRAVERSLDLGVQIKQSR